MTRIRALRPRGPSTTIGTALALIALLAAALGVGATTAPATAAAATPVLRQGTGLEAAPSVRVRALQRALHDRGYHLGPAGGRRPIRPRHRRRRAPPAGAPRARDRWRGRAAHAPRARTRSGAVPAHAGSAQAHGRDADAGRRPPRGRPHVAGRTARPLARRDLAGAGLDGTVAHRRPHPVDRHRTALLRAGAGDLARRAAAGATPRTRTREPTHGARRPSGHRVRRRDGGPARPRRRQDREGLRAASLGPARGRRRARRPSRGQARRARVRTRPDPARRRRRTRRPRPRAPRPRAPRARPDRRRGRRGRSRARDVRGGAAPDRAAAAAPMEQDPDGCGMAVRRPRLPRHEIHDDLAGASTVGGHRRA